MAQDLYLFDDNGNPIAGPGGAFDFGDYLVNSMTPEQQAEYLATAKVDQEMNGTKQAPQIAYEQPWSQQRVQQEKDEALAEYQQVWNQVAEEYGYSGGQRRDAPIGSDPRVKAAAEELHRRQETADRLGVYGGDGAYQDPETRAIQQAGNRITDADRKNRIELEKLKQLADQGKIDNQAAVDQMGKLIDAQDPLNQQFVDRSVDLATQLGTSRDTANRLSNEALGDYTRELTGLNASNNAAIDKLGGVYDQLSTPIAADLRLDPDMLAKQNEALSFLGGGMNGALDYQSQAAGAYADPRYVAMRDQGLADLYGVSQGSKDVHVGQADPAAYAAARQTMDKASELSNPAVTDAENFLYEQARQRWESEMRGVAAAKMSQLRRRGMAGGGAELTSTALSNADISQKRVLADLAASAQAVNRASDMLKLKGAIATNLNEAGNALATGNANRQLQALGLYEQGAETAQQSSFDQEYKRGVAADNAAANNQQTRLASGIAYGNQANKMQDQAYQVQKDNKAIEIGERDALWGRTTDLTGLTLNKNAQNSNNASNIFQGRTSVASNNYVRDRDVIQGWDIAAQRANQGQNQQLDRRLGVQGQQIGINNTNTATQGAVIGQNIANNQWVTGNLIQNDQVAAGKAASDKAALDSALATIDANERADSEGILGLPIIGSRNGLLGGFGAFGPDYDEQRAEARRRYGG